MSAVLLPEPSNDVPSSATPGSHRIALIMVLATVWLALGALAGLLIGLFTGLIPFSC